MTGQRFQHVLLENDLCPAGIAPSDTMDVVPCVWVVVAERGWMISSWNCIASCGVTLAQELAVSVSSHAFW